MSASVLIVMAALSAGPANVALVTSVQGDASYRQTAAAPAVAVRPYMKAQQGDIFELRKGAVMRLVYYRIGHQESWTGPVKFEVGAERSRPLDGDAGPAITKLPPSGVKVLQRMPGILKRSGVTRKGAYELRGKQSGPRWRTEADLTPSEKKLLAQTREAVRKMRLARTGEDPTPELVLTTLLVDLRLESELAKELAAARKRFPNESMFIDMQRWARGAPAEKNPADK